MTARMDMVLTGDVNLSQQIRALPRIVREECLEDATIAAGLLLLNAIKSKAIELGVYETGTLVRSYHLGGHTDATPEFNSSEGYGDIGGVVSGADSYSILAGTNLPYARRQEFGFDDMTDSLGRTFHQKARPHIRPAFDEMAEACMKEFGEALAQKLKARAGR